MGTAGTPAPAAKWPARLVVLAIFGALILIFGQRPLSKWRERDSVKVQRQREWICQRIAELRQIGPPSDDSEQRASYSPWITPRYLIFSNSWAAYRIHTSHSSRLIGEVALLRTSDGRIYSSKLHYCVGIADWMLRSEGEIPCPADADDFFGNQGKRQQWNLLSPDGRVMCVVFCSSSRSPRKTLWISIGNCDDSNATNFFVGRYPFTGEYLGWTTHWNSGDDLSVDVFAYVRNPLAEYPKDRDVPTNYLATLTFHRDRQTGRFTATEL